MKIHTHTSGTYFESRTSAICETVKMNSQHLFYIRKVRIQQKSTCPRSLTKASGITYTKVYFPMRKNISSAQSSVPWSAFSRENSIVPIVFGAFGVTTWHQGFYLGCVGGNVYFLYFIQS